MVLKIERTESGSMTTFSLAGSIDWSGVQQLKAQIARVRSRIALDLRQVRLVDLDAAHFLAAAEGSGIALRGVPRYVREWILLERARVSDSVARQPPVKPSTKG